MLFRRYAADGRLWCLARMRADDCVDRPAADLLVALDVLVWHRPAAHAVRAQRIPAQPRAQGDGDEHLPVHHHPRPRPVGHLLRLPLDQPSQRSGDGRGPVRRLCFLDDGRRLRHLLRPADRRRVHVDGPPQGYGRLRRLGTLARDSPLLDDAAVARWLRHCHRRAGRGFARIVPWPALLQLRMGLVRHRRHHHHRLLRVDRRHHRVLRGHRLFHLARRPPLRLGRRRRQHLLRPPTRRRACRNLLRHVGPLHCRRHHQHLPRPAASHLRDGRCPLRLRTADYRRLRLALDSDGAQGNARAPQPDLRRRRLQVQHV
mmetsp:Transcript_8228/g.17983  ORF Transcript_8228/g.17983 Transcript_8228/m.17983 type:complete len:316 (-) Transcript_8228:666-1613(-)